VKNIILRTCPIEPVLFELFAVVAIEDLVDADDVSGGRRPVGFGAGLVQRRPRDGGHLVEQIHGVRGRVAHLRRVEPPQRVDPQPPEELVRVCLLRVYHIVRDERNISCKN